MRWLAVLVPVLGVIAGCKGKETPSPAEPPALAAPPPSMPAAPEVTDAQIDCLFDQARAPREAMDAVAETSPLPLVRRVALRMVDRAKRDGASPMANALRDAIEVLAQVDDLDGLRAAFAIVDAVPGLRATSTFEHDGAARARVGLAPTRGEIDLDPIGVVVATALAGDTARAKQIYAKLTDEDRRRDPAREPYVAAKLLLGESPLPELDSGSVERRLEYIVGGWLDTELRRGAPVKAAVDAAVDEVTARAPNNALSYAPLLAVFRRAARLHRGVELAPLYKALVPRLDADQAQHRRANAPTLELDLATAIGDAAEIQRLSALPEVASYAAKRAALFPTCPPPAPPVTATPPVAGLAVTVAEVAKKPQFECDLRDVRIALAETATKKVIGEQMLPGRCDGVCTAADRRAAAKEVKRIEADIAAGNGTESQLDYNYTQCLFEGPGAGRIDKVGGRDVAIVSNHYVGAHDIDRDEWQLALEVCGQLVVSQTFGRAYSGAWKLEELALRQDGPTIVVDGKSDRWTGVVFRLTLPACPGEPAQQSLDTE